ncbi:hypothetical protein RF11_00130 [Thelohanellus kitauei]|uniref:Uncharacterized protein n=1 Tax=Thelohanellus kitauei TaxID=669202 RepID=A0A0C2JLU3_THEKT|nr:hypothetical protein RF11_00130 [Thelohanellus kitauei]
MPSRRPSWLSKMYKKTRQHTMQYFLHNQGIMPNDKIFRLDSLDHKNFKGFVEVTQYFSTLLNKSIRLAIVRGFGTLINVDLQLPDPESVYSGLELLFVET